MWCLEFKALIVVRPAHDVAALLSCLVRPIHDVVRPVHDVAALLRVAVALLHIAAALLLNVGATHLFPR
jgi:hypothetical protein